MSYSVIRSSSIDISQHSHLATFATREEAERYIRDNSIDQHGNVSADDGCDYLRIDDGEEA